MGHGLWVPLQWGHRGCSRVGVLLRGLVGVLCWCSGHVWGPVRGRASVLGEARFGKAVVCGCSLVAVSAGGAVPGRGSGCGQWWALSWRVVCGVSGDGAGGGGWGAEPAWCGVVPVLVGCGVSSPWVGEGSAVWHGGAWLCGGLPAGGGGGHRVQVWWSGWLLVAGPRAVWVCYDKAKIIDCLGAAPTFQC